MDRIFFIQSLGVDGHLSCFEDDTLNISAYKYSFEYQQLSQSGAYTAGVGLLSQPG